MTKSKFDFSLLKPVEEKKSGFDTSKLKPINNESEENNDAYNMQPESALQKLPRNIGIGLAKLGHSTINMPHDIIQGLEKAGKGFKVEGLTPEIKPYTPISSIVPHQQEYNFAKLLGQKGEGTFLDKLIQKGVEYAPELASGSAILRHGLRRFPITQRGASRQLRQAENLINEINAPAPISLESIEDSRSFLPRTHATNEMLNGAERGDYRSSFATQSQVGHHERNLRKSPLASERLLAPQARELKQNMLGEMESALRTQGHHEAADLLRGGINDYRQYVRVRDTVFPILKKIGVPTTLFALLGLGVNKSKNLLKD